MRLSWRMAKHFDPNRHNRRSIRLPGYDYRSAGAYFVTICTYRRAHLFGTVSGATIELNPFGRIAVDEWQRVPEHRTYVQLDAWTVMPDHVHVIVWIAYADQAAYVSDTGRDAARPRPGPAQQSLGAIIGSYKAAVARHINRLRGTPGGPVWQEDYYECIVRTPDDLVQIRNYIRAHP